MQKEALLTADELATRLHVRPSTVRRWSQEQRIPAIRLTPKVVRYDLDAVIRCLRKTASGEKQDSPWNAAAVADNPATLVAEIIAAHKAGDRELEHEMRRQLKEGFGVKLSFGSELCQERGCER